MGRLEYCESGRSVLEAWVEGGFSPCFLDTLTVCLQLLTLLALGLPQEPGLRPSSCLRTLHLLVHVLPPCVELGRIILHILLYSDLPLLGHHVLKASAAALVWPIAIGLIEMERRRELPTPPGHGHGIALLVFWAASLFLLNLPIVAYHSPLYWWHLITHGDKASLGLFVVEYTAILAAFVIGLRAPSLPSLRDRHLFHHGPIEEDEESGGIGSASGSTWKNAGKKMRVLLPYLWPKRQLGLQLRVLACVSTLVAGRIINLYVPLYYKYIVNELAVPRFCWDLILVYAALRFLQGSAMSGGFVNTIRSFLWITVQQYTTREIQVELYRHLHNLSLRWHLGRKTGEVLRVMDRGTNSINSLLSYILFNIGPTFIDIFIALVYFTTAFNAWFGLIVFLTMAVYLSNPLPSLTPFSTPIFRPHCLDHGVADQVPAGDEHPGQRHAGSRRRLTPQLRDGTPLSAHGVPHSSPHVQVKYYNNEEYEVNGYRGALVDYQKAEWVSMATLSLLNSLQNIVIGGGLLAGSLLCARFVVDGKFNVGDYVMFATYIIQLYQPLNYLGTYYRQIQTAFIDMENMLELLEEKEEVKDVLGAGDLRLWNGSGGGAQVEFRSVSFSYEEGKSVLQDVSFLVPPGETLAIVGPSGSGKSTVLRLLFRFYNLGSGTIFIDGQDISQVTQESLRRYIGVVPQDTVLFNNSIKYNIAYGRIGAEDEDVESAAKAADIHSKILGFPKGYDTVVGERGLKLSGGEKQRVAIARTLLKQPPIVLLDEATSALDSGTERNIQASLTAMSVGRTTVVVAHRLSTIRNAHNILVLDHGVVQEFGGHEELIKANGMYAEMWRQQLQNETDEDGLTQDED